VQENLGKINFRHAASVPVLYMRTGTFVSKKRSVPRFSHPLVPLGVQASIFGACPKPGDIGRVEAGRASHAKMGG